MLDTDAFGRDGKDGATYLPKGRNGSATRLIGPRCW